MLRKVVLLIAAAALPAALLAAGAEKDDPKAARFENAMRTIYQMKRKTSFLNLFNGLYLSADQLRKLIAVNEEYKKDREEHRKKVLEKAEECAEILQRWVEALEKGDLPKDLMRKAGHADHLVTVATRRMDGLRAKYKDRVEAIFTDAQKEVIRTFKPCVVPPRNLKDPVRAGQADSGGYGTKTLERLRRMPPRRFWRELDRIVNNSIEGYARRHPMTEEDRAAEYKRLREFLIEVYEMKDVDFEMNKEKLAREAKVRDKGHTIREEIEKLQKELKGWGEKARPGSSPVARWFLNPAMLPVMKERLAALESGDATPSPESAKSAGDGR